MTFFEWSDNIDKSVLCTNFCLKGLTPQDPLYFFYGQTHRVTKFSGTFKPTEHDSEKKWWKIGEILRESGFENAWIWIHWIRI